MIYIDTLADIQRERYAELLREAETLRMLKEAQKAHTTTGKAARAEANPFAVVVATLLALPDRLKTA